MSEEQLETTFLDTTPQEQAKPVSLSDLKAGYVVGLSKEGELLFEPIGTDQGLVELLGLHAYATIRIDVLKDLNQGLVGTLVKDLTKVVASLAQQVARLVEVQKRPTNKLG